MRKVILNIAVSLDGFIEGPQGSEYDWCFTDQDYGMTEFFGSIDTIFLGRKSYELLASADDNPFPGVKKFVFSDTLTPVQHEDVEIVSKADFEQTVKDITKQDNAGDIWLFGGASVIASFMAAGLISDFMLSVHPVILGSGKPLFYHPGQRTDLMHTGTETYSSGLVQLRYVVKPQFDLHKLDMDFIHSKIDDWEK